MRVRRVAGLAASALVAVAAACSSYGSGGGGGPADAGGGDATSGDDAGGDAALDADADAAAFQLHCPPPRAPSCAPESCTQAVLFTPPASPPEYVHGITTDDGFVYWGAQTTDADGGGDPYNGSGVAHVRRVRRDATAATVLASDEPWAGVVALDGDYLYWSARLGGFDVLRRVPRACAAPCPAPETVTSLATSSGVAVLVRAAPGILFAQAGADVVRIVIANDGSATATKLFTTGIFPTSLASTDSFVYATALGYDAIGRVAIPSGTFAPRAYDIPQADGSATGLVGASTDCTALYGFRTSSVTGMHELERVDLGDGGFSATPVVIAEPWSTAADERYVYATEANTGGVFAIDKQTGTYTKIASGNVWNISVDGLGVYWGDHDGTGSVHMMAR